MYCNRTALLPFAIAAGSLLFVTPLAAAQTPLPPPQPAASIEAFLASSRASFLLRHGAFGLLWWQMLALPLLALIAFGIGRILHLVIRPLLRLATTRTNASWDDALVENMAQPVTLVAALIVFGIGCNLLNLDPSALGWLRAMVRGGLALAVFWGLWRGLSVFMAVTLSSPWARQNPSTLSLLTVGSNMLRGAVIVLGALAILGAVGYPVTTVLAGLGIGGLALAFGAQKTVADVFGSMALAVDQPLRVGDFVKVEDFVGTVEDIGLRSTRFRTLDRTVVTIPNGKLADQRLESFQLRDRMRLAATIGLTYDTTREQMKAVLEGFDRVLRTHPRIWPNAITVKFKEFGASSLDIDVMAWFQVPTWDDFQVCREHVLLEFMRVVEQAGTSFAFPTQTVHIARDSSRSTRRSDVRAS